MSINNTYQKATYQNHISKEKKCVPEITDQ